MTVSKFTYSAAVLGSPNRPLSVRGASFSLDESAAPHVTARVDIASPGTWGTTVEAYSGWTEVRRNYAQNPQWVNASRRTSTVAGATGTTSLQTTGGPTADIRGWARYVITTAPTASPMNFGFSGSGGNADPIQPNTLYTFSAYGITDYAGLSSTRIDVRWFDSTGTQITNVVGPSSSAYTPGVWHRRSNTLTSPANAATVRVDFCFSGPTGIAPGQYIGWSGALIEKTDELRPAFDGTTTNTTLQRYVWTGLTNASPSTVETRTVTQPGGVPVFTPDADTLAALDTRMSPPPRVRFEARSTDASGAETVRAFNLTLRERPISSRDGTLSLSLASDEALLADWAPLADDESLFTRQSSLRSVVSYVLGKVIPGASFPSGPDAPMPVYADATNEMANPSAIVNTTGWNATNLVAFSRSTSQSWAANSAKTAFNLRGTANTDSYIDTTFAASGMSGRVYLLRARQRTAGIALPSANAGRLRVFTSNNGGASYRPLADAYGTTAANTTANVTMRVGIPVGTTHVIVRAYHGFNNDQSVYWSDFRMSEYTGDPTDTGYFDGNTTNTSSYTYTWESDAGLSVTKRVALIDRNPESLLWKSGQSALEFLIPLVQSAGLRLVCSETRTWSLRAEDYAASGALAIRHGVNMIDAEDRISRDDAEWFDAAVTVYRWTDRNGVSQERRDAYGPTGYSRVRTFERTTPYPGPGFSEYAVRRAQGRGREVTATAVADLRASAEQPITVVLDGAPIQTGKTSSVTFDFDRDEMTVTTRTTDTPAGAIDLAVGTIAQAVGTIDEN
ncbi:hypothetical protein RWH45_10655 [Microbacterium sp. KSW4-17]|uniref:Uncharacterized protein n=1 Tax=Microbacterium galbum TaxID=3075994 RepID=A0ABU3T8I9_9MICO|nr:hypothetical protein [Microbacterium sp. KSW4-17]MDU0367678.1 hypothetical protein [Microbacterium sp. KSW4-17]